MSPLGSTVHEKNPRNSGDVLFLIEQGMGQDFMKVADNRVVDIFGKHGVRFRVIISDYGSLEKVKVRVCKGIIRCNGVCIRDTRKS